MAFWKIKKILDNNVDKVAHFGLSNFFCWISFLPLYLVFKGFWWSISISVIFSFTLGLYKEKRDSIFDNKDLIANILGILFFIISVYLIN